VIFGKPLSKKKKIYRQNIFLQVLSFIASKNNTLRRLVNTLSDRLAIADPAPVL
jgi:hypothetical protein